MSFYTFFDWFTKLRLFVNERNLRGLHGVFNLIEVIS